MTQSKDKSHADSGRLLQNAHWLWLSALVIACDQIIKQLVTNNFSLYQSLPLTPWLNLTLVHNTGAAFSILRGAAPWAFVVLSVVVVIGILVWMRRHPHDNRLLALALSLVAGGALGNAIDRATRGYVIDFVDFHIGTWHYPAFNLADCAICIGAALIVIDLLIPRHDKK